MIVLVASFRNPKPQVRCIINLLNFSVDMNFSLGFTTFGNTGFYHQFGLADAF